MKWPFHIYGKRLRFVDPTKPQEISTADRFSLQYGEGCCGTSTHDNRGRSCADVYFIYDQRGCGLIDSGNKGLWSDVSCHEKKIALCEKARRQIYKHYVSVQARLDFDTADKYCAKYYGTHLATIHTPRDNEEVQKACGKIELNKGAGDKFECWVGLRAPFEKWQDSTSATAWDKYANWYDTLKGRDKARYKLILRLKDVKNGYFQSALKQTGLENPETPDANTYSILGELNPDDYKLPKSNKYQFKLVYTNKDGKTDELIWRQSSWLDRHWVTGFESVQVSHQRRSSCTMFRGLAASGTRCSYFDGNGRGHCWWNSVGTICPYRHGIPAFNHRIAKSQALYVYEPKTKKHTRCAIMRDDGKWYEERCDARRHFVCDAQTFAERLPPVLQHGISNWAFRDHEHQWYRHKAFQHFKDQVEEDMERHKLPWMAPLSDPWDRIQRQKMEEQRGKWRKEWEAMRAKLRKKGVFKEYAKHGYFWSPWLDHVFRNDWRINYGDYPPDWRHDVYHGIRRRMMDGEGENEEKKCRWIGQWEVFCVGPNGVEVMRVPNEDLEALKLPM